MKRLLKDSDNIEKEIEVLVTTLSILNREYRDRGEIAHYWVEAIYTIEILIISHRKNLDSITSDIKRLLRRDILSTKHSKTHGDDSSDAE